jgi:hypothetical protein
MILDILPWVGLGALRFGMKPSEVQWAFDENPMYEDWMGGNLNDSLLYKGMILGFDQCDSYGPLEGSRFCEVRAMAREDIWLFGKRLSSWSRKELVAYIEARNWLRQDGPEKDIDIVDLAVGLSFDASNHIDYVEFCEPGIRIIGMNRILLPGLGFRIKFQGWPLRKEYRCLRTASHWEYVGALGPLSGPGPYEGTLRPLGKEGELRPGDKLVPVGNEPRVPTSTSPELYGNGENRFFVSGRLLINLPFEPAKQWSTE